LISRRRPDVDFPRAAFFVAEVYAPVQAARQSRSARDHFVSEMHLYRGEQRGDSAAQLEESTEIGIRADDMDVEIAPRHQLQRVAADDVDFSERVEEGAQS